MSVIQPSLYIPPAYQAMLNTGELWRDGGVLRRAANGTIALILKDGIAPKKDAKAMQAAQKAVQKINIGDFIKNHKAATATGIAGLLVSIGVGIYLVVDKVKSDKVVSEAAKRVSEFQSALTDYLKKATSGGLELENITRLIDALDKLEAGADGEHIVIDLTVGELSDLVNCIINYTGILATANKYPLDSTFANTDCTLINLRHHLQTQKEIFDCVA